MTEGQKNRKLKKIEQLKKVLQAEKRKFGGYDDSYGRRYSIAELYFEIGDYSKTNRYLNWFNKNFPDEISYPHFQLGAAVTYLETKKVEKAIQSIVNLNSLNLYVVDLLLKYPVKDHSKYEWSQLESLSWANNNIDELRKLVTHNFISWLVKLRNKENYQVWYKKYLSISKLIEGLEVSRERTSLLVARDKCLKSWGVDLITTDNIN